MTATNGDTDAADHDTTICTHPDHPGLDCLTPETPITADGIDGEATTWTSYRPGAGRRVHLDMSVTLTSTGLAALIATLQAIHRAITH